ncbi:hypothetical protein KFE25_010901 [Diacronema lutheri]|uniref:START domain-containing protein n=1 Tax=Diacronema lutheri TaxID=2081491 RepID=A0A8J5X8P4_DIALT|nr:hypothetical protein KFE25_010901 [Diacronema lutheri]
MLVVALAGSWRVAALVSTEPLLTPSECSAVKRWAVQRMHAPRRDVVDIHAAQLRELVGHRALFRLRHFGDEKLPADARVARRDFAARVSRHARDAHMELPRDARAQYTLNVALTDDDDVRGGRLLAADSSGSIARVERRAGDATVCTGDARCMLRAVAGEGEGEGGEGEGEGENGACYLLMLDFFGPVPDDVPGASRGSRRFSRAARHAWSQLRRTVRFLDAHE